jgi:hypothetical protein
MTLLVRAHSHEDVSTFFPLPSYHPPSLLTGPIPTELLLLTDLNVLKLDDNKLTGTIPVGLWSMNLTDLELGENLFTGTLPLQMGFATALRSLKLSEVGGCGLLCFCVTCHLFVCLNHALHSVLNRMN